MWFCAGVLSLQVLVGYGIPLPNNMKLIVVRYAGTNLCDDVFFGETILHTTLGLSSLARYHAESGSSVAVSDQQIIASWQRVHNMNELYIENGWPFRFVYCYVDASNTAASFGRVSTNIHSVALNNTVRIDRADLPRSVMAFGILPYGALKATLFWFAIGLGVSVVWRRVHEYSRRLRSRCVACGYPIDRKYMHLCPECGVTIYKLKCVEY